MKYYLFIYNYHHYYYYNYYNLFYFQCNRPGTKLSDISGLQPVRIEADPSATITAGNASQLSDGASACVLMEQKAAERRGIIFIIFPLI